MGSAYLEQTRWQQLSSAFIRCQARTQDLSTATLVRKVHHAVASLTLRATATIRPSRCQALPTSKIQRRRSFEGGNRLIGLRRLLLTSIHDMYGTTHEGASSHLRGMPAKVLTLLAVARDGVEERHVCGGQLKRWRFQVCSEVLPMGRAQDRRAAMLQHPREQHLRW